MSKKNGFVWLVGIAIFCIDRITKSFALECCVDKTYYYNSFLSYDLVINRGISWGMFHSTVPMNFLLVSVVIALVTVILCGHAYYLFKIGSSIVGHVFVIAGSLSNLVDRVYFGGVIDFIILSFGGYSWPVFNIADVAIVIGIGIMIMQYDE